MSNPTSPAALCRRLFPKRPPPDNVFLIVGGTSLNHKISNVEWYCGRAYAAPYDKENTRCELLAGGKVAHGPCYVLGWKPMTPRMQAFFDGSKE